MQADTESNDKWVFTEIVAWTYLNQAQWHAVAMTSQAADPARADLVIIKSC